ncbi:phosphatase 2C-like domain-containing protein [Cerioporus squamosus]|nr:phosphatase 2C-like domain-containing protein [Cerioporus squamosus]
MERLKDVKRRLKEDFTRRVGCGSSAHGVTFKSPSAVENEDRMVIETAIVKDQSWALLAVFDGHSGSVTADYAAQYLPRALRSALKRLIDNPHASVDRTSLIYNADVIATMLQDEIRDFDASIGLAVRELCENPKRLTREQAMQLIDEHEETIERAFQGTTVALALINADHHMLWAAALGNSTIALSIRTLDDPDVREADRLCASHALSASEELSRLSSSHPSEDLVDDKQRLLGLLPNVSRAIGDFHLKYDAAYLDRLFSFLPHHGPDNTPLREHVSRIKSPPYVSNEASVRFVNYGLLADRYPILMLYTDGVDRIVLDCHGRTSDVPSRTNPADVVTSFLGLSPQAKTRVEDILGHEVEVQWDPSRTPNIAVDVLGNLLGGTDVDRLKRVIAQTQSIDAGNEGLDLDDTTIILCDLTILKIELDHLRER